VSLSSTHKAQQRGWCSTAGRCSTTLLRAAYTHWAAGMLGTATYDTGPLTLAIQACHCCCC
jgi:hypothetical protein